MKTITAMSIDLAKSVFQVLGVNQAEKVIFNKKVSRNKLLETVANVPPCEIFMEACGSAHYWARRFEEMGHKVKLIAGQHVKKFVVGNKSDAIDALAIVTCGLRPSTRFVPIKKPKQLEIQAIHRIRSRLVKERTALSNEIRGLLYEHGVAIAQGEKELQKWFLESKEEGLPPVLEELIKDLFAELRQKHERVKKYDQLILRESHEDESIKRLMTIPGVGILTASAIAAEVSNANDFKNGRDLAAFFGLVPGHSGSGGKTANLSISKRGDKYIRMLLIQGAQSSLRFTAYKQDPLSLWCEDLKKRRGIQKAAVALANKNTRIIWRLLTTGEKFRAKKAAA